MGVFNRKCKLAYVAIVLWSRTGTARKYASDQYLFIDILQRCACRIRTSEKRRRTQCMRGLCPRRAGMWRPWESRLLKQHAQLMRWHGQMRRTSTEISRLRSQAAARMPRRKATRMKRSMLTTRVKVRGYDKCASCSVAILAVQGLFFISGRKLSCCQHSSDGGFCDGAQRSTHTLKANSRSTDIMKTSSTTPGMASLLAVVKRTKRT